MSKLSQEIKECVSCPQINGKPYGRWGALNSQQKIKIWNLAHQCEVFESVADDSMKELTKYKRVFEILKDRIEVKEVDCAYILKYKGYTHEYDCNLCYIPKEEAELIEELKIWRGFWVFFFLFSGTIILRN